MRVNVVCEKLNGFVQSSFRPSTRARPKMIDDKGFGPNYSTAVTDDPSAIDTGNDRRNNRPGAMIHNGRFFGIEKRISKKMRIQKY